MDKGLQASILSAQKSEITEHLIYSRLSEKIRDKNNARVLKDIAEDELSHHDFWRALSKKEVSPT